MITRDQRSARRAVSLAAALSVLSPAAFETAVAAPSTAKSTANPCLLQTREAERRAAVPEGLLSAMAYVESGRWRPELRLKRPWPWTLRAGTRFWYLPSREAALDTLRTLKDQGVENVDVGCMQINLRYHPSAFASLDDALDPEANVAYAAAFLRELKEETGSWQMAAGYYHSRNPKRSRAYLATVEREWRRPGAPVESPSTAGITRAAVHELRALCDQVMASLARLRHALKRSLADDRTIEARMGAANSVLATSSHLTLDQ